VEALGRADRGDKRRGLESTEAWDRREAAGSLVFPGLHHELGAERRNVAIQLGPFQTSAMEVADGIGLELPLVGLVAITYGRRLIPLRFRQR